MICHDRILILKPMSSYKHSHVIYLSKELLRTLNLRIDMIPNTYCIFLSVYEAEARTSADFNCNG